MIRITVRQLGEVITGHTPPTSKREYYGDSYPFLKPTDMVIGQKYTYAIEEGYSDLAVAKYKNSLIPKGSTCVVCIGTLGEKMSMAHCDLFTNQSINSIIPDNRFDQHYVYYLLKHNLHRIKALNKGTASGREFVSKSTFLDLEIDVIEDKEKQTKVAQVLSTYDDLIDNNHMQIKFLEESVQRLYKKWFVDLEFPGNTNSRTINEIPEGWRQTTLSEVAVVNKQSVGKDYPYSTIKYVDIGSVSNGHILEKKAYLLEDAPGRARRLADDGDVIWGMVRPNLRAFALVQIPNADTVFSTGFAVISAKSVPFTFLYCLTTTDEFVGYLVGCTNGAAYPAVKPSHFEAAKIIVPNKSLLDLFHQSTEPIFRKIGALDEMNTNLMEARDRLLPKLMSGEIEL